MSRYNFPSFASNTTKGINPTENGLILNLFIISAAVAEIFSPFLTIIFGSLI